MDGELVKECIDVVADTIIESKDTKQTVKSISLSRRTVTRRTEELRQNLREQLDEKIKKLC